MCPCRVLVVDDNADVRESLVQLLQLLGHHAEGVGSGVRALEALRAAYEASQPFSLALVDITMPDMTGYELVAAIRQDVIGNTVTVAALTGRVAAADRERAEQAGFDAHQAKPVDMNDLQSLLHRVEFGMQGRLAP